MKVRLFNWGRLTDLPEWFRDGHVIEITMDQLNELIELKYQIMIKRWNGDPDDLMLCVDDHSFRQH